MIAMHVVHVIHSMDRHSGGPSQSLRELCRTQIQAGHRVTIVTTDVQSRMHWLPGHVYKAKLRSEKILQGIDLVICHGFGRHGALRRFRYSPGAGRKIEGAIAENSSSHLHFHIHGLFSHIGTAAAAHCRRHRAPYAIRPAGGLSEYCLDQGNRFGKSILKRLFLDRDIAGASFIYATSEREKDDVKRLYPDAKIVGIPHGVIFPSQSLLDSSRKKFAEKFPQLTDKPFVLFMGRLTPKKGCEMLLEAFAKASNQTDQEWRLVIAGEDCGSGDEIKKTIVQLNLELAVIMTGFLSGKVKHGALAAAEIFALPSIDENFGLAVTEAMAHETCVLTCPGVDSHRYVDEAHAGLTVDRNVESLTSALLKLMTSDRKPMSRKGRLYVREHLSWREITKKLDAEY